jgi:hypothetical protein
VTEVVVVEVESVLRLAEASPQVVVDRLPGRLPAKAKADEMASLLSSYGYEREMVGEYRISPILYASPDGLGSTG